MLGDMPTCKTMLPVNTMGVKPASTSLSRGTWNPGACTYMFTYSVLDSDLELGWGGGGGGGGCCLACPDSYSSFCYL